MPPAGVSENALLQQLLAGQGATDQRFEELFRRMEKNETTASEARDWAKEAVTIMREQNALARVAELKAEAHQIVADLRQDVVAANTELRKADIALEERVQGLEDTRTATVGMAKGGRLVVEGLKMLIAAGGGAWMFKLFGGH